MLLNSEYSAKYLQQLWKKVRKYGGLCTNSQSGMGLLKCGNVVIPFDNQIRKDTSLYKLYNTNLHEKISEMKEKEKHVSVV